MDHEAAQELLRTAVNISIVCCIGKYEHGTLVALTFELNNKQSFRLEYNDEYGDIHIQVCSLVRSAGEEVVSQLAPFLGQKLAFMWLMRNQLGACDGIALSRHGVYWPELVVVASDNGLRLCNVQPYPM